MTERVGEAGTNLDVHWLRVAISYSLGFDNVRSRLISTAPTTFAVWRALEKLVLCQSGLGELLCYCRSISFTLWSARSVSISYPSELPATNVQKLQVQQINIFHVLEDNIRACLNCIFWLQPRQKHVRCYIFEMRMFQDPKAVELFYRES